MAHKYYVVYNTDYGGFGLSDEALEMLARFGFHGDPDDLERHDRRLVAAVRRLGSRANGHAAALSVYTLRGSKYKIDNYDGVETVVEPDEEIWIDASKQPVVDMVDTSRDLGSQAIAALPQRKVGTP